MSYQFLTNYTEGCRKAKEQESCVFVYSKGIVLPFIYVGKGKMPNPRKQVKGDRAKGKDIVTYLYDNVMENELPDYLQYDFGLTK